MICIVIISNFGTELPHLSHGAGPPRGIFTRPRVRSPSPLWSTADVAAAEMPSIDDQARQLVLFFLFRCPGPLPSISNELTRLNAFA